MPKNFHNSLEVSKWLAHISMMEDQTHWNHVIDEMIHDLEQYLLRF